MIGWLKKAAWAGVVATVGATGYMLFESQWLRFREMVLPVPSLPQDLVGLRVLHLSDIHAGQPSFNLRTLRKALQASSERDLDLVFVTGDITDGGPASAGCLASLRTLQPRLGVFMVPGNHEYGLSKNPLVRLNGPALQGLPGYLRDSSVRLTAPSGLEFEICGADYLTRGFGLIDSDNATADRPFSILITHRPPGPDDPLLSRFPLVFAGHTHGGQIRLPGPTGPISLHSDSYPHSEGVHRMGGSIVVISRGLGTTFVPFRLLTRPEAVVFILVRGTS